MQEREAIEGSSGTLETSMKFREISFQAKAKDMLPSRLQKKHLVGLLVVVVIPIAKSEITSEISAYLNRNNCLLLLCGDPD